MCDAEKQKIKQLLTEAFKEIDKDNSGFLDQSELEAAVKACVDNPDCPADCKAKCNCPGKIKECCEVWAL